MDKAVLKELNRWLASANFRSLPTSDGIKSFYKKLCVSSPDLGASYVEDPKETEDSDWALKIILSYNTEAKYLKFEEVYVKICFETANLESQPRHPRLSENSVFLGSAFIPLSNPSGNPSDVIEKISNSVSALLKKAFMIFSSMAQVAGSHALTGV